MNITTHNTKQEKYTSTVYTKLNQVDILVFQNTMKHTQAFIIESLIKSNFASNTHLTLITLILVLK